MESWRRLRFVQLSLLAVLVLGPASFALVGLVLVRWHWPILKLANPCMQSYSRCHARVCNKDRAITRG